VYSGGLPRAVEVHRCTRAAPLRNGSNSMVQQQLFHINGGSVVPRSGLLSVRWCLRGQPLSDVSLEEKSEAVASFGVRFDAEGVPSLPPFMLNLWAKDTSGEIANVLKSLIPLSPPQHIGDATTLGGQRLTFEKLFHGP
jgi:hypothetical protein